MKSLNKISHWVESVLPASNLMPH